MKISLNWLNAYINIETEMRAPKELGRILTEAGLEVESIEDRAKGFAHVVVGSVLKKDKHPNSDRLSLCQVAVGDGVVNQIVCGATNHKEGDRVVVALPGAHLPNGVAIAPTEIRGIASQGMLCSEDELGLAEEGKKSEGILILEPSAKVGTAFAKHMSLDDTVLELKVTPNRADCLSHVGLARELSTLLKRPLRDAFSFTRLQTIDNLTSELTNAARSGSIQVRVEKEAQSKCLRYAGQSMTGIQVGESPQWLKSRLKAVGVKSINNVVDVTNYVMFELGQPLHAFDASRIQGSEIQVRLARPSEPFTTLDGTKLTLKGEELVICDQAKPVALAGVVGGENSGVSASTTEIFIEAALFESGSTRRTGRLHGVQTESGYRFSRGVNSFGVITALNRAVELMTEIASGKISGDPIDLVFQTRAAKEIEVKLETVSQRLGLPVQADQLEAVLVSLGCEVLSKTAIGFKVRSPLSRQDLEIEMDLVEEYARLVGYDKIPETLPASNFVPARGHAVALAAERLRLAACNLGFLEARNFAFVSDAGQRSFVGDVLPLEALGLHCEAEDIRVLNPISEDLGVMRKLLSYSLYQNALFNLRKGNMMGSIFEVGVSHSRNQPKPARAALNSLVGFSGVQYSEEHRFSVCVWGAKLELGDKLRGANEPLSPVDRLVELIPALTLKTGLRLMLDFGYQGPFPQFLHPGQRVALTNGNETVGFLGALHPEITNREKVRVPVAVCEIAWSKCLTDEQFARGRSWAYSKISPFPAVERDFAFLVPKDIPIGSITAALRSDLSAGATQDGVSLRALEVFDVFASEKLPLSQDQKVQQSIALRLKFESTVKTFSDEQIKALSDQVINSMRDRFQATLRG